MDVALHTLGKMANSYKSGGYRFVEHRLEGSWAVWTNPSVPAKKSAPERTFVCNPQMDGL